MDAIKLDGNNYKQLLKHYIETQDEKALYGAEQITKSFIKNNIFVEEIVNLHIQALKELNPRVYKDVQHDMNFLLETMISYGLAHQEYQALREKQLEIESELSVAANMQTSLLSTTIPEVDDLDIGVISVPANRLNGDYHHFLKGDDGSIGIVVADVIGKGVPAALCMSMIKYSIDSFPEESLRPKKILKNLNRVVEKNIEPGMFITMFYGQYFSEENKFTYASAGHEPGYYYNAKRKEFTEIVTKGLVLGVSAEAEYPQYEQFLEKDDMIILLTDGVTECRKGEQFIEPKDVLTIIENNIHLSAQKIVEHVYKHFERLQNFQLRDDFTLVILRRKV